jgi:bifunctional non-homologous end joining protein LigD
MTVTVESGSRRIEVSNADKVFFPDSGITKGDLVEYYDRIGETMLRHVVDRALSLHRFPDGIEGEGFFQKDTPDHFPDWIARESLKKEGGTVDHPVCEEEATLAYIADQGCITPHVWLSRVDRPDHPDRMVFDFDPPEADPDLGQLHHVVGSVGDRFDELGIPSLVMTTGSAGYHVLVPLDRSADFDAAHEVARKLSEQIVGLLPDETTAAQRKDRREGKVFVDYLRNSYAQTTVAPYSVRALPGAPIATPISWDELSRSEPRSWSMGNIFRRLGQVDDPWRSLPDHPGIAVADIASLIDQGGEEKDENESGDQ